MTWLFRTMIVPDSIVATVRSLADSFGPAASGMWITPLSPTSELPATHWISSGFVGDDFAAVLPLSHYVDDVWVTEPYDPAAFIALCATYGIEAPTVEQITQIMGLVDVSDQEPFAAMARLGLFMVQTPIEETP